MANGISSLFGPTAEEFKYAQQQANKERQQQQLQQGLAVQTSPLAQQFYQSGYNIASGLGNLFGPAPMADPRLAKSIKSRQIMSEISAQDLNDPEKLSALAQQFTEAQMPEAALYFADRANTLNVQDRDYRLALAKAKGASAFDIENTVAFMKQVEAQTGSAKEDLKKDAYTRKSHDIITDTMQGLMKLNYDIDDIKTIKEATSDFIDYLEQPETDLLSAGFNELDKVIPGVPRHSLMVLGADSGVGKTVFSINQAINKCLKGEKVLFISLEIKIIDLVEIIIPYLSKNKITYADVLNAKNNPEKIALIKEIIIEELNELGLFFATNCYSIDQVISAIDYHRINYDIDCVFLDHAQLISGSEEYNQYVSLTKTLMQYKNKNNISIQLLSQFNDKKDNRADKEPRKTDLRAGGNLYQDADIVLFLYKLEDSENKVYLKLAKNRKGANNKVLYFDLDFDGKSRRIFLNPCDKPVKEEPAIPRKPFWEKKKKGMNDDD